MWVLFPTDQKPREPGLEYIGYVLGVNAATATTPAIVTIAYTTSQLLPPSTPVPQGLRVFDRDEAATLNQKPFVMHLRRLATLPLTPRWFHKLNEPHQGLVARATRALREALFDQFEQLAVRRPDLITQAGPYQR